MLRRERRRPFHKWEETAPSEPVRQSFFVVIMAGLDGETSQLGLGGGSALRLRILYFLLFAFGARHHGSRASPRQLTWRGSKSPVGGTFSFGSLPCSRRSLLEVCSAACRGTLKWMPAARPRRGTMALGATASFLLGFLAPQGRGFTRDGPSPRQRLPSRHSWEIAGGGHVALTVRPLHARPPGRCVEVQKQMSCSPECRQGHSDRSLAYIGPTTRFPANVGRTWAYTAASLGLKSAVGALAAVPSECSDLDEPRWHPHHLRPRTSDVGHAREGCVLGGFGCPEVAHRLYPGADFLANVGPGSGDVLGPT